MDLSLAHDTIEIGASQTIMRAVREQLSHPRRAMLLRSRMANLRTLTLLQGSK